MKPPAAVHLSLIDSRGPEVEARAVYSAAMLAIGMSFVLSARAGEGEASTARLESSAPAIGWTLDFTPTSCVVREDATARPALEACAGMRKVRLRLLARQDAVEDEVTLVDPWHWPLDAESWPLLAAFVLPHDGTIARLQPKSGRLELDRLFERLGSHATIDYQEPQVMRTRQGAAVQALRPPWRLISDLARLRGAGSCLDLSLLAAGLLESSGRMPLLLFVLDDEGYPRHAMIACWREPGRRFRPILRGGALLESIRARAIEVMDLVPVCVGRARRPEAGRAEAARWIESAHELLSVDIVALRPPHGSITPFELALDSEVAAAIALAERHAFEGGDAKIESAHLLRALLRADSALSRQLAGALEGELGIDPHASAPGDATNSLAPERTRGFGRCLVEARDLARTAGSTVVREVDLWWAVLGTKSASVERLLAARPGARHRLIEQLSAISPPVRPESES